MLLKTQLVEGAVFKVINADGTTDFVTIDEIKSYEITTTIERWRGLEVLKTSTRYFESLENAQCVLNKYSASPSC